MGFSIVFIDNSLIDRDSWPKERRRSSFSNPSKQKLPWWKGKTWNHWLSSTLIQKWTSVCNWNFVGTWCFWYDLPPLKILFSSKNPPELLLLTFLVQGMASIETSMGIWIISSEKHRPLTPLTGFFSCSAEFASLRKSSGERETMGS